MSLLCLPSSLPYFLYSLSSLSFSLPHSFFPPSRPSSLLLLLSSSSPPFFLFPSLPLLFLLLCASLIAFVPHSCHPGANCRMQSGWQDNLWLLTDASTGHLGQGSHQYGTKESFRKFVRFFFQTLTATSFSTFNHVHWLRDGVKKINKKIM